MKKGLLSAIALICILFVILYASAVFLPHDHHGCDSECIACAVAGKWEILISGMVLCALLCGFDLFDKVFTTAGHDHIAQTENTPVKLRVKLSN